MSIPRLPFLWPMLFEAPRCSKIARPRRRPNAPRSFTAVPRHREEVPQRYGTAQEPAEHLRKEQTQKKELAATEAPKKASPESDKPRALTAEEEAEEEDDHTPPRTIASSQPSSTLTAPLDQPPTTAPPEPPKVGANKPLDTVLHMPSPQEEEQRKPPHLKTPPYVHHFDTYSLVKDLTKSGFTHDQSVSTMKAVRSLLADNMELARDGLVSKSNVENETYLFRAACSELKTEVGNTRKSEIDRMRAERAQLQHEVDILGQRLGQETSHLKDELKGLFDDRKMTVRQEQRNQEGKIQQLNYKITVALNSDARSEVESLRWVLTRRAAMTIGISAFILFVSLRYLSYLTHLDNEQRKREEEERRTPPYDGQVPSSESSKNSKGEPLGGELLSTEGGVPLA